MSGYPNGEATVSQLAEGTPDQVRACILAALKQKRDLMISDVQDKAKDLAEVNSLIDLWKKKY